MTRTQVVSVSIVATGKAHEEPGVEQEMGGGKHPQALTPDYCRPLQKGLPQYYAHPVFIGGRWPCTSPVQAVRHIQNSLQRLVSF